MKSDQVTTLNEVKAFVKKFIADRDWDQFHNAKNLSMQIAAEAAELMEFFLWVDGLESSEIATERKAVEVEQEVADILIGVLCFCNKYNIDLTQAIAKKMEVNAKRYPVEKAKGRWTKYHDLDANSDTKDKK